MMDSYHIVDFRYCKKCIHKNVPTEEDPCDLCLEERMNYGTTKPVEFKEKKD